MMRTSVLFLVFSALVACSLAAPAAQTAPSPAELLNTLSAGLNVLSKYSVSQNFYLNESCQLNCMAVTEGKSMHY